ncbi:MAG: LacI family DNA-binding transcriptional regulator [Trueperaceae bacterium]|nr:LacI family DNA-binding transcriptional regulator [Trueperaceae bacterium]
MSRARRPKVTSHTVAERAGVSRTTVSFVLNDRDAGIPEETRARVLRAAAELDYVPSAAAQTLASGQARTLGLVVCQARHLLTDAFLPQAVYGLTQVAKDRGYRTLVEPLDDVRAPHAYQELVRAKQIDGLLVLNPRADDRRLPELIDEGFPVVTIGRPPGGHGHSLDVDNVAAAHVATAHLLALGHHRIAHLGYGSPRFTTVTERLAGYRAALEEAGAPVDDALVAFADYSAASGAEAMRTLLARTGTAPPPFTALFCSNDTVAFGAMAALRDAGLCIPEDVAVVGFDDVPLAAYAAPPLTTVRSPLLAMAESAANRLVDLVEGLAIAEIATLLPTELVVRASCGGAPDPMPTTPTTVHATPLLEGATP